MLNKFRFQKNIQESSLEDNRAVANVLKSISDNKSLSILQTIAAVPNDATVNPKKNVQISLKALDLTTKQYYTRISAMLESDLIKRQNGRYYVTPLGKVIYCCAMIAKYALKNYYNLKAVEANEASGSSNEEINKLVDALIDNQTIKEFLNKKC